MSIVTKDKQWLAEYVFRCSRVGGWDDDIPPFEEIWPPSFEGMEVGPCSIATNNWLLMMQEEIDALKAKVAEMEGR